MSFALSHATATVPSAWLRLISQVLALLVAAVAILAVGLWMVMTRVDVPAQHAGCVTPTSCARTIG